MSICTENARGRWYGWEGEYHNYALARSLPPTYKVKYFMPFAQECLACPGYPLMVDIGAGTGEASDCFEDCGGVSFKVERSSAAFQGSDGHLILSDMRQLPLGDECAAGVHAKDSVIHIPDKSDFFIEAFRVLRQGGRLLVCDVVDYFPLTHFSYEVVSPDSKLKRSTVFGIQSDSDYKRQIASLIDRYGSNIIKVGPPYFACRASTVRGIAESAGFVTESHNAWKPESYDGDWYNGGSKRYILKFVKPQT